MNCRQMIDISIITINYNDCDGVCSTMESILNQELFLPKQIVFIDGNSIDGSIDSFKVYQKTLEAFGVRVICISEPDKGLYDAMNKGLRHADGKYVWFMNSGDSFCNDSLKLINDSAYSKFDFLYGNYYRVLKSSDSTENVVARPVWWNSLGMISSHQAMVFNRGIIENNNIIFDCNYKYAADYDFISRYLKVIDIEMIKYIPFPLCNFDITGVSNSRRYDALVENYNIRRISQNMNVCVASTLYIFHLLHTALKNKFPVVTKLLRRI